MTLEADKTAAADQTKPAHDARGAGSVPIPYPLLAWTLVIAAVVIALLHPAIYNGFPIIFFDTGGYLSAALDGEAAQGRAAIYGALLVLGIWSGFWLAIVLQAAASTWLVVLSLRVHGLAGRPLLVLAVGLGLAALTGLPWLTSQVMPDIWFFASVIALYTLAFRASLLRRWERVVLAAIVAFAAASHMAALALLLGLVGAFALLKAAARRMSLSAPRLAGPLLAIAAGIAAALGSNLVLIDRLAFTPGGVNFLFGRVVGTGLAARYLDEHCPDANIRLCAYKDSMPTKDSDWLWSPDSPLYELGGWEAFEGEAREILVATLVKYPLAHVRHAIRGMLVQMVKVATGDGLQGGHWHTHWVIESKIPELAPAFFAARQQQDERALDFSNENLIHVPVGLAAMLLLPLVVYLAVRRRVRSSLAPFAGVVLLALVGNAAICGALSSPYDRYQNRLVPAAALVVFLAALTWHRRPDSIADQHQKQ